LKILGLQAIHGQVQTLSLCSSFISITDQWRSFTFHYHLDPQGKRAAVSQTLLNTLLQSRIQPGGHTPSVKCLAPNDKSFPFKGIFQSLSHDLYIHKGARK
jgi:hypothetical protein